MKPILRLTTTCAMMLMLANGLTAKPVQAQEMPDDYQEVLAYLGKKGDFKAGVLKVSIPRNDLKVTVAGVETPTPFGFGGWLAMTKGEGGFEVMMGDFVLLQEEVNPVMSALLDNGLEVTALHNHFFWEEPRLFYHHMLGARPAIIFLHYWGQGSAEQLAQGFRAALDELGRSK